MYTTQDDLIHEIQQKIVTAQNEAHFIPVGGGSKTALSGFIKNVEQFQMANPLSHQSGMVTYDPAEYTFSASAGMRLAEIHSILDQNGQYMPFDPPMVNRGATLGGAVASGLNGPGRYRFGGMRDFILAVQFIDGQGNLIKGGAKVVKNSAGFDLPKLMVGSLGRLGILTEITIKIFPRPMVYGTIRKKFTQLEEALSVLRKFTTSQLDVECLELEVNPEETMIVSRMGGSQMAIGNRMKLLDQIFNGGERLSQVDSEAYWESAREFNWVPQKFGLVKIPLTPSRIPAIEESLRTNEFLGATRRVYSYGGQQLWLATDGHLDEIELLLRQLDLTGLIIWNPKGIEREQTFLGERKTNVFAERVKNALDPYNRFLEI